MENIRKSNTEADNTRLLHELIEQIGTQQPLAREDGKEKMKRAIESANKATAELQEARSVKPEDLNQRITV